MYNNVEKCLVFMQAMVGTGRRNGLTREKKVLPLGYNKTADIQGNKGLCCSQQSKLYEGQIWVPLYQVLVMLILL